MKYVGQTVVITGGGSGLGQGMALAFAAEGAHVAVIGRRPEALAATVDQIKAAGGKASAHPSDVRDADKVAAIMTEIASQTGGINVLVNNAAGNFIAPSEKLSPNGFKAVIDIVLCGTFNCSRFAFEHLAKNGGSILNIIATYAWLGEPGAIHSASAKAGVLAMTQTLAAEWGPTKIRSNAIAPGPVHTEGTDKNLWSVGDVATRMKDSIPLGRLGEVDDVSRAAVWICSSDASWVNGATLTIDGGQWLKRGAYDFRGAFEEAMAKRG